jgi:flavin-dependent dehydrogenase
MNIYLPPVVIGSSFAGVLVSLSLSRAGVQHILIGGDEPDDSPRLGESLNECASPELFSEYSEEFPDCFHTKSHISLLNGDYATQVVVANPGRCKHRVAEMYGSANSPPPSTWRTFWGCFSGQNLMHVDRTKLDRALYWKSRQHECCQFISAMVDNVVVNDDQVETLVLSDGQSIQDPQYVFDTIGFRQVVGTACGVETMPIGKLNRVVWAHYQRNTEGKCPERWWNYGTNLLKLEHDTNDLAGISWMIPLGNTVSVGISVDAERYKATDYNDDEIMRLTNAAYADRGVDFPDLFPDREKPIMELTHKYYSRGRAYGKNWLLVGGSYISVWFPSSAGLWTVAAANRLIPRILDDPLKYGAEYEQALAPLTKFHEHLDKMINGEPFRRPKDAYLFWARWLAGVPSRTGEYLRLVSSQKGERSRFRWLGWVGHVYARLPVTMLIFWGFFVLRIVRQPQRSQQANQFRSYFNPTRYRVGNYLRALATSWRS